MKLRGYVTVVTVLQGNCQTVETLKSGCDLPVMARRTSLPASSRASTEACSLYQDVCGVQMRLGASFRGPVEKLFRGRKVVREDGCVVCSHVVVHG